jgi:hypothetical protein
MEMKKLAGQPVPVSPAARIGNARLDDSLQSFHVLPLLVTVTSDMQLSWVVCFLSHQFV